MPFILGISKGDTMEYHLSAWNNLYIILLILSRIWFNKKEDDSWRPIGLEGE